MKINTENQYLAAREQLAKLQETLANQLNIEDPNDTLLQEATIQGLRSMIADLQDQIQTYLYIPF